MEGAVIAEAEGAVIAEAEGAVNAEEAWDTEIKENDWLILPDKRSN